MNEYELELETISGFADGDYLDRLADVVYELPTLVDPLLAVNDDGSISASFCVSSTDPVQAAKDAAALFLDAVASIDAHANGGNSLANASVIQSLTVSLVEAQDTILA